MAVLAGSGLAFAAQAKGARRSLLEQCAGILFITGLVMLAMALPFLG